MGKKFSKSFFDLLGADAGVADFRIAAFWVGTNGWDGSVVAANMAAQTLVGAMIGERETAIGTAGDIAALRALQGAGITAAVEKKNGLLIAFEAMGDGVLQLG